MSDWTANMATSLEKWGPKSDRRLRMVAIPVNNGDVEDALAEVAAMREALGSIADRACHEIRERGPEILWCPDHMKGGRVFWCDSCIARDALARAAEGEGKG